MLLDVAPVEIRALAWGAIMHPILYTIPQTVWGLRFFIC